MELSVKERLILANQYRILEVLCPNERDSYARIREAIEAGYRQEYHRATVSIDDEGLTHDECNLVREAVGLYQLLGEAYDDAVDKSAFPHGRPQFPGFDGNNETAMMAYARFLIEEPLHYDSMKRQGGYNSHTPMADRYEEMIGKKKRCANPWQITPSEALEILER